MKRRQAKKLDTYRDLILIEGYGRHYWHNYKHDKNGYWQYLKMVTTDRHSGWHHMRRYRAYRKAFDRLDRDA